MSAVYDAGALVAADRNDRGFWAEHSLRLQAGDLPLVPAPVLAQVSRSPRQVQLRRALRGCQIETMTEKYGHAAGALLAATRGSDVVDATVAVVAAAYDVDDVVTSDRPDIRRLLKAAGARARIIDA